MCNSATVVLCVCSAEVLLGQQQMRDCSCGDLLRVILIKVGEEQLAAAGLSALTGQVHGLDNIYKSSRTKRG